MTNVQKKPHRLRNDILLIVVLVLVATVGCVCLPLLRGSGDTVTVTVDGEVYGVYPLSKEHTEDIRTGENGTQLNRLIIRDGKALVETATCPDGICAAHRAIQHNGESIVCLPHRVVITVTVAGDTDAPDVVA